MAKKSTAKTKKSIAKTKKTAAKTAKRKATGRKAGTSLKVPLHEVVRLMTVIANSGGTDTSQFAEAARQNKAFVSVDDETMKFVRRFLRDNNLSKEREAGVARVAARRAPGDPFSCF